MRPVQQKGEAMKRISGFLGCLGLMLCAISQAEPDACGQFAWNVSHELALFGGASTAATAGKDAGTAPQIATDQLYELTLSPQAGVSFAHTPSKKALNDGAYAGLARVRIPAAGVYRVALNSPLWVDVVSEGKVLRSGDFTGNHACKTLSKLVEFQMPAGEVLLQLSGAGQAHVRVALTASPKAKT